MGSGPAGTPRPWIRVAAVAGVAIVVAHLLDPLAQRYFTDPEIYSSDFGRLLRVQGFYLLWVAVGVSLFLHDWPRGEDPARKRDAARRGGMILLAPALGGLVAEIGKISFRRLRPGEVPGEYLFRSWAERPFHSGGLGLPSSHTLVAFAGAAILARLFPRAAPVFYLLAAGCGLSRVAAGAHFLSDIVVAAVLGWLVAAGVWRWNFGRGEDPGLATPPAQGPSVQKGAPAFTRVSARS